MKKTSVRVSKWYAWLRTAMTWGFLKYRDNAGWVVSYILPFQNIAPGCQWKLTAMTSFTSEVLMASEGWWCFSLYICVIHDSFSYKSTLPLLVLTFKIIVNGHFPRISPLCTASTSAREVLSAIVFCVYVNHAELVFLFWFSDSVVITFTAWR
jgi:hypothetical protein